MTISVIIPTKNRLDALLDTVRTVLSQSRIPDEMIIIDQNESEDIKRAVYALIEGHDIRISVTYIHDPGISGLTQARNRAVKENSSDIILFLDDDVLLESGFVQSILDVFTEHDEVYGVSGIITNTEGSFLGDLLHKIFMKGAFKDHRYIITTDPKCWNSEYIGVSKLFGGLTGYRKEVFGLFAFDENFVGYALSEDYDFSFRVSQKFTLAITPKARLEHVGSDIRGDYKIIYENLILSMKYFYIKNLDKNFYNTLCYVWLLIGYFSIGIIRLLVRQRADVLAGVINGLKSICIGKKGDFIKAANKTEP